MRIFAQNKTFCPQRRSLGSGCCGARSKLQAAARWLRRRRPRLQIARRQHLRLHPVHRISRSTLGHVAIGGHADMAGTWRCLPMIVAVAVALASNSRSAAAEPGSREPTDNPAMTAEQILANPLDESAYARKSRCLARARYRRVDIIGDMALAFHGRGKDVWLNVLPRRCPGLRENMVLTMELSGLRVCARDRFRAMSSGYSNVATSICTLGMFERMTTERLDAMRDALVAHQNTQTVARTARAVENENAASGAAAGGAAAGGAAAGGAAAGGAEEKEDGD